MFLVFVVALITYIFISVKERRKGFIDNTPLVFKLLLKGFFCFALGALVALVAGIFVPNSTVTERKELVALRNIEGLEGTFLFMSGSFNHEYVYSYWYQDGAGGYRRDEVGDEAYDVVVYEDATAEDSHLLVSWKTCEGSLWAICLPPVGKWYEFHIPPGSLVQQYSLN